MSELPGKIRVQDATLANMVTIAAILEYLDQRDPGAKELIEGRAHQIAQSIRDQVDEGSPENGE